MALVIAIPPTDPETQHGVVVIVARHHRRRYPAAGRAPARAWRHPAAPAIAARPSTRTPAPRSPARSRSDCRAHGAVIARYRSNVGWRISANHFCSCGILRLQQAHLERLATGRGPVQTSCNSAPPDHRATTRNSASGWRQKFSAAAESTTNRLMPYTPEQRPETGQRQINLAVAERQPGKAGEQPAAQPFDQHPYRRHDQQQPGALGIAFAGARRASRPGQRSSAISSTNSTVIVTASASGTPPNWAMLMRIQNTPNPSGRAPKAITASRLASPGRAGMAPQEEQERQRQQRQNAKTERRKRQHRQAAGGERQQRAGPTADQRAGFILQSYLLKPAESLTVALVVVRGPRYVRH